MKHILEYNQFDDQYKVISYEDNFENPEAYGFNLTIESPTDKREYELGYDLFLDFIMEIDPNLKSYLVNRDELDSIETIFGNLEELGFDYQDYLQKYVDHVTKEIIDNFDKSEIEEGNIEEDDIDDYEEDDEEDDENENWWKK